MESALGLGRGGFFIPRFDLFAYDRRDLCSKEFDGMHHLFMFDGTVAHIHKEALMFEDVMLEENLFDDLIGGADKIGAAEA